MRSLLSVSCFLLEIFVFEAVETAIIFLLMSPLTRRSLHYSVLMQTVLIVGSSLVDYCNLPLQCVLFSPHHGLDSTDPVCPLRYSGQTSSQ